MRFGVKRLGKGKLADWGKRAKSELMTAQRDSASELVKEYERVVADWDHRPSFIAQIKTWWITIKVKGPNAKIWEYVNWGTRRHKIRAKNKKALSFVWGGPGSYQPKTRPIGKFGGPGTVTGGERVAFQEVDHPGNKPRLFSVAIRTKYIPKHAKHVAMAVGRIFR